MKKSGNQRFKYFISANICFSSTINRLESFFSVSEKLFQTIGRTCFISAGCLLLVFGALNAHSTDDECRKKFIKPKKVKLLPPELLGSLSDEELYALQPKHLFLPKEGEGLGELRLTVGQFQALQVSHLHPKTFEQIAKRPDVLRLLRDEQVQELDLNTISPNTLSLLMNSPLAESLSAIFQELDFSQWSKEDLEPFIKDPSIAQYMSREQSDAIKRRRFLNREQLSEQKKAQDLQRKKEDMAAVQDHGIFDQAIAEGNFDKTLIPFLRVAELNDDSVQKIINIIHEAAEKQTELSSHIFKHLSKENIHELVRRDHRSWEEFYQVLDSLDVRNILQELRFAELNDEVIEKIRKALFHRPLSSTNKISKENIAELIRRDGGLDAVTANNGSGGEYSIFTILFREKRLTDEILEYVLSERPDVLEDLGPELMSRIPKHILTTIVFGDKSSELSESTFQSALKASLKIETGRLFERQVSLSIEQMETLIRDPRIISREELDKEIEEEPSSTHYYDIELYRGRKMPKDLRGKHFKLLHKRLKSLLDIFERFEIRVSETDGTIN